jgi:chromate transporter
MTSPSPVRLNKLVLYFLRLGATGFGGPIALASYMHRELVEQRSWISPAEYKEGLALAQLAPGPLAAQLAIYLGWVRGGVRGATLVALAFILPSFLMVLALAALYLEWGGLPWMQGAFYGIGAAVVAVIGRGAFKLVQSSLGHDGLLWSIFGLSSAVTAYTESEIAWLFLASGVVVLLLREGPRPTLAAVVIPPWLLAGLAGPASTSTLTTLFWYFAEAGTFVFGSGLAILPFLYGGVVGHHHWLNERQFLDAIAVAMITPGPVVITVAFIGYLVSGPLGATSAAIGVFLPCYLLVVVPAPYFKRFANNPRLRSFVDGVTAAATGAIAGAAFVLGKRAIVDAPTACIALATILVLLKFRKVPEPLLILTAGAVGVFIKP